MGINGLVRTSAAAIFGARPAHNLADAISGGAIADLVVVLK